MPSELSVSPFAAQHGDYAKDEVVDLTGDLGEGRNRIHRVMRNRGGTTVERWLTAGSLSRTQAEAITLYSRAWHMAIGEPRVSANWNLAMTIRGMPAEDWIDGQVDAMATLRDLDKAIFKRLPPHYRECWQNVVIFDEAAGVAGSRLGFRNKGSEAAARMLVLMVADLIASDRRL